MTSACGAGSKLAPSDGIKVLRRMIDRQKVETILRRRFPNADWKELATAVNAIMGLGDEWEEVRDATPRQLRRELEAGVEFRVFRRAQMPSARWSQ